MSDFEAEDVATTVPEKSRAGMAGRPITKRATSGMAGTLMSTGLRAAWEILMRNSSAFKALAVEESGQEGLNVS